MEAPRGGSSHYTFRKSGCYPITIPKHEPIKRVYVQKVKEIVEAEYYDKKCVISYPDLIGCMSSGETIEEAVKNGEDARREWIIATLESGMEIPKPFDAEEYSGQFRLRMPKSLHKLLAERSKQEGISMNQYCIYLLSHYS